MKKTIPSKICRNDCQEAVHTYNEWWYPDVPAALCPSPYTPLKSYHFCTFFMLIRYLKHVLYESDTITCVHVK